MIIQVIYDLKKNNEKLEAAIKNIGVGWARPTNNSWLIATTKNPNEVYDLLITTITENDILLVSRFDASDSKAWVKPEVQNWMNQYKFTSRDLI
jgi:hypothetical protein